MKLILLVEIFILITSYVGSSFVGIKKRFPGRYKYTWKSFLFEFSNKCCQIYWLLLN